MACIFASLANVYFVSLTFILFPIFFYGRARFLLHPRKEIGQSRYTYTCTHGAASVLECWRRIVYRGRASGTSAVGCDPVRESIDRGEFRSKNLFTRISASPTEEISRVRDRVRSRGFHPRRLPRAVRLVVLVTRGPDTHLPPHAGDVSLFRPCRFSVRVGQPRSARAFA